MEAIKSVWRNAKTLLINKPPKVAYAKDCYMYMTEKLSNRSTGSKVTDEYISKTQSYTTDCENGYTHKCMCVLLNEDDSTKESIVGSVWFTGYLRVHGHHVHDMCRFVTILYFEYVLRGDE